VSPFGYWLVRWQGRTPSPQLQAFEAWVLQQAAQTRSAIDSRPMPAATRPPAAALQ
jgi:hypothetical protein